MDDAIQTIRFASDIGMFTLIWLVQLIIYPAFLHIERDVFVEWHERYTKNISFIVMPLMMAQAFTAIWMMYRNPVLVSALELFSLLAAWITTFTLSVPCHKKLHEIGRDTATVRRLIDTNWIRTAAWTVVMLLGWIPEQTAT